MFSDESDIDIKLVNGTDPYSGLINVLYGGEWRFVCGDHWTNEDAEVACRQLGFSTDGKMSKCYDYTQIHINNTIMI